MQILVVALLSEEAVEFPRVFKCLLKLDSSLFTAVIYIEKGKTEVFPLEDKFQNIKELQIAVANYPNLLDELDQYIKKS